MAQVTPCIFLFGDMKKACENAQAQVQAGNSAASSGAPTSLLDILTGKQSPLSWRHVGIRVAEIVVGTAMIIVGIKALTQASPTVKVIGKGAKKVWNG